MADIRYLTRLLGLVLCASLCPELPWDLCAHTPRDGAACDRNAGSHYRSYQREQKEQGREELAQHGQKEAQRELVHGNIRVLYLGQQRVKGQPTRAAIVLALAHMEILSQTKSRLVLDAYACPQVPDRTLGRRATPPWEAYRSGTPSEYISFSNFEAASSPGIPSTTTGTYCMWRFIRGV